ncbi:MAG: sensor domain-containing diguanylate cyclase [Roseateles sp.]|uniref:sensor domain-containing diguanylate cyclase n=1 Tax=Roseateles sp. TaxID=1971397 RepID=UPI0040362AD5
MQAPIKPVDERRRLLALRALRLLDSAPEERFDRITRLARRLFDMPIALVSLVDGERQWFKSAAGLDIPQTPRDISFCGHAILGEGLFIIPDTRADARFADNPLVTGPPHVRFYAGYTLKAPNGSKLGTLCLLDSQPRDLPQEDRSLLGDLARMAELELVALQLATTDELTMLPNRRGFEALAQHALQLAHRQRSQATLLFFDLNNFKDVNDRFGHAEGDEALAAFAGLLSESFRESDLVARLGGDEFLALLIDSDPEMTAQALRRLRNAVADYNRLSRRGYGLSFSVGQQAYSPDAPPDIRPLLAAADAAMYVDKRGGQTGPCEGT